MRLLGFTQLKRNSQAMRKAFVCTIMYLTSLLHAQFLWSKKKHLSDGGGNVWWHRYFRLEHDSKQMGAYWWKNKLWARTRTFLSVLVQAEEISKQTNATVHVSSVREFFFCHKQCDSNEASFRQMTCEFLWKSALFQMARSKTAL